jgi:DNA repair exonuclease SbcCD ATPase subunit
MKDSRTSLFGTRLLALALLGVLATPVFAAAQQSPPLAEIARKEAERRKTIEKTGKVITAKDLPEAARKPAGSTPAGAPAAGGAAPGDGTAAAATGDSKAPNATAGGDKPDQKPDQKNEAYWRGRLNQAQESARRAEAFAEALQTRINSLTADFANAADAYQRAKVGEDRQKALAELERVKGEAQNAKKQVDDIQEEARKAGVPPGWLR